jgi:hypothetical protein
MEINNNLIYDDPQLTFDVLRIPNINNQWQKYRLLNDKVWLTREKKKIKMTKMSTGHIVNCIKMLEISNQKNTRAYRGLVSEIEKRFIQ